MKERPIIFSAPMVRSLINGSKTQTRRIAREQSGIISIDNPYGHAGDMLWIKEAWRTLAKYDELKPSLIPKHALIEFKADCDPDFQHKMSEQWRTPLFMPKVFSRLKLEILDVRYEKLMECSQLDAIAEGVVSNNLDAITRYKAIWEALHGIGAWCRNPWVWVIEFKIIALKINSK